MRGKVRWPYRSYLVLEPRGLIYCPIPKVASGNLKLWFLAEAKIPEHEWRAHPEHGIHPYVHHRFRLRDMEKLDDERYLKLVFVRNPFSRLVSAFLDKVVRPLGRGESHLAASPAYPVLFAMRGLRRYDRLDDSTFEDFVELVCALPDASLDAHWLPQHRFLGDVDFDIVAPVEKLAEEFVRVRSLIGSEVPLRTRKKRQRYMKDAAEAGGVGGSARAYVGDVPIGEMVGWQSFPRWPFFYDEITRTKVAARYGEDFERFGYWKDGFGPGGFVGDS